jgi:amino acid transporter
VTSTFPALYSFRVGIALALVGFMTIVNLRGVKESGRAFAIPTYFFLGMTVFTIAVGFYRYFTHSLQLTFRGSRLAFSNGIVALAGAAAVLIVLFRAETNALIPLYAIGVYLSFTLSQTGMAVRWWRCGHLRPGEEIRQPGSTLHSEPNWKVKLAFNNLGVAATAIVMLVFAYTKFQEGAWLVIFLIPTLVVVFFRIHGHYKKVAAQLSLESFGVPPCIRRHRILVPIGGVHRGSLQALYYARSLSDDVTAVYVCQEPAETKKVREKWETWGDGVRLVMVDSPYRQLVEPLLDYVQKIAKARQPGETITIVVPQFIPAKSWHNVLHMQTALFLRLGLLGLRDIVIVEVPYHIRNE